MVTREVSELSYRIKSLRKNKYADALAASSHTRKPINQPHVLHFLREVLSWSEATVKEVERRVEHNKSLVERRAKSLTTQVERAGPTAEVLGMAPEVKKESSSDGVLRLPMKENLERMPMPVPAFPFPKAERHCLLVSEELKQRHQSVWDYTNQAVRMRSSEDDEMEIEEEEMSGDSDSDMDVGSQG